MTPAIDRAGRTGHLAYDPGSLVTAYDGKFLADRKS